MRNYTQQHNAPNVQFKINKFLQFVSRPKYTDVYQRGYKLNVNSGSLNALEHIFTKSRVADYGSISELEIARKVPDIVKLQEAPIGMANIANGWNTQRIRYILEVETRIGEFSEVSYIQGYTEYYDPSIRGTINPNMTYYINSITTLTKNYNEATGRYECFPKSAVNVITDEFGRRDYREIDNGDGLQLMRPSDIARGLALMSEDALKTSYVDGASLLKTDTSARKNNNPIKHFTSVINSFKDGKIGGELSSHPADMLYAASSLLADVNLHSNQFIRALASYSGQKSPTMFTLNLLEGMYPALKNIMTPIMESSYDTPIVGAGIMDSQDTQDTLNPTAHTLKATAIAHAVSNTMLDCLLTELNISFTNTGGEFLVIPTSPPASVFENINIIAAANKAVSILSNTMMPSITDGGHTIIEGHAISSAFGDTTVALSINGSYPVPYRFPTFADSLYSPVVTDKMTKLVCLEEYNLLYDMTFDSRKGAY